MRKILLSFLLVPSLAWSSAIINPGSGGAGDNLGNHTATKTLTTGFGINTSTLVCTGIGRFNDELRIQTDEAGGAILTFYPFFDPDYAVLRIGTEEGKSSPGQRIEFNRGESSNDAQIINDTNGLSIDLQPATGGGMERRLNLNWDTARTSTINPSHSGVSIRISSMVFDSGSTDPIFDWSTDGTLSVDNATFTGRGFVTTQTGFKNKATNLFISTINAFGYAGYSMYIATGPVAANSSVVISTTILGVSALGIPICSEIETVNTAAVSVRVKSLGLPNNFTIYNADALNAKEFVCYVGGRPLN